MFKKHHDYIFSELVATLHNLHYLIIYWTDFNPTSLILKLICCFIPSFVSERQMHQTYHGAVIGQRLM